MANLGSEAWAPDASIVQVDLQAVGPRLLEEQVLFKLPGFAKPEKKRDRERNRDGGRAGEGDRERERERGQCVCVCVCVCLSLSVCVCVCVATFYLRVLSLSTIERT